jgi:hypothetical protein
VLGHLGINVPDLDVAHRCYGQLLPLVGFEPSIDDVDPVAYPPGRRPAGHVPLLRPGGGGAPVLAPRHHRPSKRVR